MDVAVLVDEVARDLPLIDVGIGLITISLTFCMLMSFFDLVDLTEHFLGMGTPACFSVRSVIGCASQ